VTNISYFSDNFAIMANHQNVAMYRLIDYSVIRQGMCPSHDIPAAINDVCPRIRQRVRNGDRALFPETFMEWKGESGN
jgi:hypothetical protein